MNECESQPAARGNVFGSEWTQIGPIFPEKPGADRPAIPPSVFFLDFLRNCISDRFSLFLSWSLRRIATRIDLSDVVKQQPLQLQNSWGWDL